MPSLLPDDSAIADWEAFNLLCERLAERLAGEPDWRPEESELPSAPPGAYRLMAGALAAAAVDALLADDPLWAPLVELHYPCTNAARRGLSESDPNLYAGYGSDAPTANPRLPSAARVLLGAADRVPDEALPGAMHVYSRACLLARSHCKARSRALASPLDGPEDSGIAAVASLFGGSSLGVADLATNDEQIEQGSMRTVALLLHRNTLADMGGLLLDCLGAQVDTHPDPGARGRALITTIAEHLTDGAAFPPSDIDCEDHQTLMWVAGMFRRIARAYGNASKEDLDLEDGEDFDLEDGEDFDLEEREAWRLAEHYASLAQDTDPARTDRLAFIPAAALEPGLPDLNLVGVRALTTRLPDAAGARTASHYVDGFILVADALAGHASRTAPGPNRDALMFAARAAESSANAALDELDFTALLR